MNRIVTSLSAFAFLGLPSAVIAVTCSGSASSGSVNTFYGGTLRVSEGSLSVSNQVYNYNLAEATIQIGTLPLAGGSTTIAVIPAAPAPVPAALAPLTLAAPVVTPSHALTLPHAGTIVVHGSILGTGGLTTGSTGSTGSAGVLSLSGGGGDIQNTPTTSNGGFIVVGAGVPLTGTEFTIAGGTIANGASAGAASHVLNIAGPVALDGAIAGVSVEFTRSDPAAAIAWLSSLPAGTIDVDRVMPVDRSGVLLDPSGRQRDLSADPRLTSSQELVATPEPARALLLVLGLATAALRRSRA